MFTIWGRLNSHNVKKVVWAAVEAGLEWERHDIGGQFGYTPEYLAMNPNRLVPTIVDADGFTLWESNAILRYIADRHARHLWSGDTQARALTDRWMDWQITFAEAQRDAFIQLVRKPEAERDQTKVDKGAEDTSKLMAVLDEALSRQEWLSGKDFGIGDIPMGAYTHTWFTLGLNRIEAPHVRAWYERLKARPGFEYVTIPLT
ncbi:glutathione S-transferase family protein [Novosphingobium terrae]|uniref:glutathione S-transferase family protein n=1 Tax=Novosphingobium terrae TaxID=2726189 RepID=UPI00198017CF|nr:glutathione S-transferase family protein [Novosphingobium terrae]